MKETLHHVPVGVNRIGTEDSFSERFSYSSEPKSPSEGRLADLPENFQKAAQDAIRKWNTRAGEAA